MRRQPGVSRSRKGRSGRSGKPQQSGERGQSMGTQAHINDAKNGIDVVDMVIVGAGFGGLGMAIKQREAGNDSFVILEKGSDVGGTWHFNSYPGAACDVQSHMYSFSFEGNPNWTRRFPGWQEIQGYIRATTEKHGLRPFIRFNQIVNEATFDEATAHWTVRTESGYTVIAKYFVLASGPLHVPAKPKIRGLENFKGKVFHSSEWAHGYDLKGKNVVSIGTGGSAIQYVPEIAPEVKQLYVFQRTPAWVLPRDERRYLDIEKTLFARYPLFRKLHRARLYWSNEARLLPMRNPGVAKVLQKLAELFLKAQVKDPAIAKKLTPDYTIGCKRILISNKYYPAFNRPNVELVTDGILEVRENSIVTQDGVERPVDCIILGTGFVVDPRVYMKDFPVTGLGGRQLHEDWKDASEAYYGTTVTGYPNMFQLVGPNTGLGHNSIIFMIEAQVHYVRECIKAVSKRGADYIDVRADAQHRFNAALQEAMKGTVWSSGCQSWYQQADGKNTTLWPNSTWRFWLNTREVRTQDYMFMHARAATTPVPEKVAETI
jgi:cation diffusion facilitator CzcD-associated flavoprotein CzcO